MFQTPLPRYLRVVSDRGGRGGMIQPIAVWCDCNLNLPPAVNGSLLGNPIPAHLAQNLLGSVTTRKHHRHRRNARTTLHAGSCSQRVSFLNHRCCLNYHNNTTITTVIQKRKTARTNGRKSRDPLVMAVPVVFLHSNRTQQILRYMGYFASCT